MSFRTYGGWRRARGVGLFGLGAGATLVVLGCLLAPVLMVNFSRQIAVLMVLPCVLVVGLLVTRIEGVPVGDLIIQRVQWWWGSTRGYSSLRAGVVIEHPRAWQLP